VMDVNALQWEYVLLEYEDGMLEVIIKAPELDHLDDSDRQVAAEILLDGLVGEEVRIQRICVIDVVETFEEPYQKKASEIKNLSDHIKSLKRVD